MNNNNLLKYQKFFNNKGLWHVHTNVTDGKNSIDEICVFAIKKGYKLVAFTEHVRKESNYNINQYLSDINYAKYKYKDKLIVLGGFEAKILPGGDIDCKEEYLEKSDINLIAFHGFPINQNLFEDSLMKVLKNKYVDGLAHFGRLPMKYRWNINKNKILNALKENNILLENNFRYNLPYNWDNEFINKAEKCGIFTYIGMDLHNILDYE